MFRIISFVVCLIGLCSCTKEIQNFYCNPPEIKEDTIQFRNVDSYIAYGTHKNSRNTEGDIVVLNDYTLFCAYSKFGPSLSDFDYADIVSKKSYDGGITWKDEKVICQNFGNFNVMSVSLLKLNDHDIRCYFLVVNSYTESGLWYMKSDDNCSTWSEPRPVIKDPGYSAVINCAVRKLSSGRILIPVYHFDDVNNPEETAKCYCYYSDDNGETFKKSSEIIVSDCKLGGLEPEVVELNNGKILMSMRVTDKSCQYFSISEDGGITWGEPYGSNLQAQNTPVKLLMLPGAKGLIAIHNIFNENIPLSRYELGISLSVDNGKNWNLVYVIDNGSAWGVTYSYPSLTLYDDVLLISYWEGSSYYSLLFKSLLIDTLLKTTN